MIQLFHDLGERCSKATTEQYSTSFASAIKLLHKDLRQPIFNIYGFVRLADEIVDSFHDFDKSTLLHQFKTDTYQAIDRKLSLNPILNSFQRTVHAYDIDKTLIAAFFESMEMDLNNKTYDTAAYRQYIYGSAESVGLMCLFVFCEGDKKMYESLKAAAQSLGAAFQKVNFLRDLKADFNNLNRMYFPSCDFNNFNNQQKKLIEDDIQKDFEAAYAGILNLPTKARFGVYVAYKYYNSLFYRIKRLPPAQILDNRIRIPNIIKAMIIVSAGLKNQLRLI